MVRPKQRRFLLPLLLVVKPFVFESYPAVVFTFGPIPEKIFPEHFSGIIFLFISSKYGLHLGSVVEPCFGASTFNDHVLPAWLPVFPVAVTCHQKRTDHYVFGCLVTREMPKVLESCLVLFGIMFGSRPGPTQDCWAAGLHCNRPAAQCGCCAAGPQG